MKKILILLILAMAALTQSFFGFSRAAVLYPISDPCELTLPRNFRTALYIDTVRGRKDLLNLKGLSQLKISGSGQFSEKAFIAMMECLPVSSEKLIVLDLREESHGLINGNPISWTDGVYNYGNLHKTKAEIESDESLRLKHAIQATQIVIDPLDKPLKVTVHETKTEKELVTSYGATYIRLPVTDHNRPTDEAIDQFIELIKDLQPDQWLHMHCRAGKGRTTTFMTLFDIVKNAQHASLKDILARQSLIGGSNLNDTTKSNSERMRAAAERVEFIQKFYLYCQQVPDFKISWSKWLKSDSQTF